MTAMTQQHDQYRIPEEPGLARALVLAAIVHACLFAFLWIGVRWQSATPVAVEAEVWSPEFREAAPVAPPVPEPKPEPKPEVKEPPKPVVEQPKVQQPDIALEQEKKRKLLEKQKAEEEQRREKERLAKIEAEKKEQAKKDKELAAQKEKELADKKRKEELAKKADQERLDKIRKENLERMMAQAGTGGSGDAPKSQGMRGSPEYLARVAGKIKSNTVFVVPETLAGNPAVEYAVELLPDGSIRHPIRKIKSSGVPGFDEAVLNAIEKSQPFPPDKTGKVPSGFSIIHRPKDQ